MINIIETNLSNHIEDQKIYYKNLVAPLDDFWAFGIINKGQCYSIVDNDTVLGYLIVNENTLMQFFIKDKYVLKSKDILNYCLDTLKIQEAYASTYDPKYLSLCLDFGNTYEVDSLLYKDHKKVLIDCPIDGVKEKCASLDDINDAVNYTGEAINDSSEWLFNYYTSLIKSQALYLYTHNDKIIGTGEIRYYDEIPATANLGMTVHPNYRKKGLGNYILTRMKQVSYERNLTPICGTDISNIASQRTIEKSGFYPYHRIIKIKFSTRNEPELFI